MATPTDTSAQLVFAPNVLHNQALNSVKFISSCFAGAVAGILGLENWLGFALFIASIISTSFIIYAVNCRGKPAKYLPGGLGELVNPGQDNIFTFILVWTLFYGARGILHPLCAYLRKLDSLGIIHGKKLSIRQNGSVVTILMFSSV
jgi:hypothetical protein